MKNKPLGLGVWILLICWLLTGAVAGAGVNDQALRRSPQQAGKKADNKADEEKAEKKPYRKVYKKAKKAVHEAAAVTAPNSQPPAVEDPASFLSRAQEQEKKGDIILCLQILSKFINVYPRHPERSATLFRMARLAQENRQQDRALQTYALAASLYPEKPMAGEARWQASTLGFYQDLKESNPLATFKSYLLKNASFPGGVDAAKLREPLLRGWQEVERSVRKQSPCPLNLVEEVLTLWELHPKGTQPPEAALLVGELLQEQGLYWEARGYLQRARDQGSPAVRNQALVGLLEASWTTRDLFDFAATWIVWRQNRGEITPVTQARLEKLPMPKDFFSGESGADAGKKPDEDPVAVLLDWWSGKSLDGSRMAALIQCLEHFLHRSLPGAVKERLEQQLAQLQWSQGDYTQAARIYQELLSAHRQNENAVFYQDRLALSQLKERHPEAAAQIFQGMGQEKDNMWQLLSRTRLADLELGRMQTEPPQ
ncbi:MAG: tetratricopeptide repeat protein [Desulfobaccales bacterium]